MFSNLEVKKSKIFSIIALTSVNYTYGHSFNKSFFQIIF